ncbi:DUF503 domain-containing protein [Mangrovitalea sediminis]|uniref:DUF503 domain-containing protein n=1 Tax=Mangrovitalea sediminis TaxID=1982043 RepID=UPI000BE5F72B|nr:DUF503 domain-containing protein [Mangrovitalea sediminis]
MGLHIGILTLDFQLYGCTTLKDKRRRFALLRNEWGRQSDLAVCETGDLEDLGAATWSIAAVGTSPAQIQQRLDHVEKAIASRIDAPILDTRFEWA